MPPVGGVGNPYKSDFNVSNWGSSNLAFGILCWSMKKNTIGNGGGKQYIDEPMEPYRVRKWLSVEELNNNFKYSWIIRIMVEGCEKRIADKKGELVLEPRCLKKGRQQVNHWLPGGMHLTK